MKVIKIILILFTCNVFFSMDRSQENKPKPYEHSGQSICNKHSFYEATFAEELDGLIAKETANANAKNQKDQDEVKQKVLNKQLKAVDQGEMTLINKLIAIHHFIQYQIKRDGIVDKSISEFLKKKCRLSNNFNFNAFNEHDGQQKIDLNNLNKESIPHLIDFVQLKEFKSIKAGIDNCTKRDHNMDRSQQDPRASRQQWFKLKT